MTGQEAFMKYDDDSTLSLYLKEINKIPLLTRDQEDEISRKAITGDKAAQAKLIEANLRFVVNVAKKYQNQGLPLDDIISEGNIGLMNAIERFDPDKGYHFISYAVWWIRQAILKAIYEKSRMIRLPLNRANELVQIEKTRKAMLTEMGEDPSDAEIARLTGIKEIDVTDLQAISRDLVSLESPVYNERDSSNLGDFIEDSANAGPDEQALMLSLSEDIESILGTLTDKESDILRHRFGLGDRKPLSLKEIGDRYNLTKERIRQIEKKALDRLRHPSRSQLLKDYMAA
ncbi:MAG: RNA polymerase subunit sigma [Spirochaetes bacterium]|nr:MAG: RNA polymerase subunit sigma [Spirochaetota bacterium]